MIALALVVAFLLGGAVSFGIATWVRPRLRRRKSVQGAHPPASLSGLIIVDVEAPDQPIVFASQGFLGLTGYRIDEVLGRNCRFLNESDRDQAGLERLRRAIQQREEATVVLLNRRKDGTAFWNELTITPMEEPDGVIKRYAGVQVDISSRLEALSAREAELRELAEARRQAESDKRAREQWFSYVSHELRSPLNAMRAWLSILSSSSPGPTRRRAIEVLERNLTLQTRLVEDLLDAARIGSSKLSLDRRPCDLAEIIRHVHRGETPTAMENGVELVLEVSESVPVFGDFERLQQVVGNLVGNAIKFTDDGGRVRIALGADDGRALITVEDTGRGISPEALGEVFELYRQVRADDAGQRRGLGLGLPIVATIVEQHGGSVEAFSEGLGKGTRIEVRLPMEPGGLPLPAEVSEPSADLLDGLSILIVDTNRSAAEALALTLEEAGAHVDWARGRAAATALAAAKAPDLLVSGLEEEEGLALLRELRESNPGLRALAQVDARSGDLRTRLKRAGFEAVVRRALPLHEVRGRLIRLVGRQPTVLVIDDDRDSADSLALLLSRRGFETRAVYRCKAALALAQKERFGLVVTDLDLPDGSGGELAERLRSMGARRIIAVSGHAREAVAEDDAFDGFVQKPIDLDDLLARLAGS